MSRQSFQRGKNNFRGSKAPSPPLLFLPRGSANCGVLRRRRGRGKPHRETEKRRRRRRVLGRWWSWGPLQAAMEGAGEAAGGGRGLNRGVCGQGGLWDQRGSEVASRVPLPRAPPAGREGWRGWSFSGVSGSAAGLGRASGGGGRWGSSGIPGERSGRRSGSPVPAPRGGG